jgi:hypothetical protein
LNTGARKQARRLGTMLNISSEQHEALTEFDGWGGDAPLPVGDDEPMPFDDFDPWEMA